VIASAAPGGRVRSVKITGKGPLQQGAHTQYLLQVRG
jgi:hypothetical protein